MNGRYPTVLLLALAFACNRQAPQPVPVATTSAAVAQSEEGQDEKEAHGGKRSKSKDKTAARVEGDTSRFSVPFVWETSRNDPLAVARGHLREILSDNARYIKTRGRQKVPGPGEQQPSTTLVTCSDSHVQVPQFDATPEHDMFVVRNLGNQLGNALASVSYGIEELKTPVLLIVGHTDCDAVHLAVGKNASKTSRALKKELARIPQPKNTKITTEAERIKEAVIENVHLQVADAIAQYHSLVHTSKLTIVGAVYDPHNLMRQGAGKLHIVNVNSNRDPSAMSAFVAAVLSDNKIIRLDPEGAPDEQDASEDYAEELGRYSAPAAVKTPRSGSNGVTARTATRPSAPTKTAPTPHEGSNAVHASVAHGLEQLESATRESAARPKSPAVDPSIIEASLVD